MCGRRDAMQLEPPEGGSAAEPRLGGLCQLVSAVGREAKERFFRAFATTEVPIAPASLMLTLGVLNAADAPRQKRRGRSSPVASATVAKHCGLNLGSMISPVFRAGCSIHSSQLMKPPARPSPNAERMLPRDTSAGEGSVRQNSAWSLLAENIGAEAANVVSRCATVPAQRRRLSRWTFWCQGFAHSRRSEVYDARLRAFVVQLAIEKAGRC